MHDSACGLMACLSISNLPSRRRPVLTRAMPPQDEAPLLVEDHSQSLETLLLQLPWDALDSISADSVQQQLLPAVANMLDVLLAHSQEPMGVPSALLTIVRILAMVANRCAPLGRCKEWLRDRGLFSLQHRQGGWVA